MLAKRQVLTGTSALAALVGVWGFNPYQFGVIQGSSMAPTLKSGQVVIVERGHYRRELPRPGEIVVFRRDGATYVKRVYAGGGETISLLVETTQTPSILIQPIRRGDEERVREAVRRNPNLGVRRLRVPEDSFFALGDNLGSSLDSRDLGPIDNRFLIGRVLLPPELTEGPSTEVVAGRRRPARRHLAAVDKPAPPAAAPLPQAG